MLTKALLVRLDAKHGMETAVEQFLLGALPAVRQEPGTRCWFALRFGRGEYGIFDAFQDEASRQAHLAGKVAASLIARTEELLAHPPRIEKLEVVASKMPAGLTAEPDTKALLLSFKPKSGHDADVELFLRDAQSYVAAETGTTAWFAIRHENGDFGIFDIFPDNGARFAHLTGHVSRELARHSLSLLGGMPDMHLPAVLAEMFQP